MKTTTIIAVVLSLALSAFTAVAANTKNRPPKLKVTPVKAYGLVDGMVLIDALAKAEGTACSIISVGAPKHGQVTIEGAAMIKYVPNAGFFGIDRFTFTVQDIYGATQSARAMVKVLPAVWKNSIPKAGNFKIKLKPGSMIVIDVRKRVFDKYRDLIRLVGITNPKQCKVVKDARGLIHLFVPATFTGKDAFSYTVADPAGAQDSGTITVNADMAAADVSYKTFAVCLGAIQRPIIATDAKIDVAGFFSSFGADGAKKAALALAQAYVTLLYLSGIEADLDAAGADATTKASLLKTIGPNYFLSTVAQESQFATNASVAKSGFYQLDFMPRDIAWDATTVSSGPDFPSYLEFLMHDDRDNVINALTLKGFCSSSIIAGYYSVMTLKALKKNTAPVTDLPLFGINYCKNTLNNLSLNLTANVPAASLKFGTSTDSYSYTSDTIMMGMLAVFYNRGRSDATGINFVSTCSDGVSHFTEKFIYQKDDESAAGYTGRYIYQIQTAYNSLLANGNASAANVFQPTISFADVQAHIDNLDQLYAQDVRQVGINTANALMGSTSYSYSSPDFYNVFSQVVTNMIERSKKRWQPVQATLAISGATVSADKMPLLDVYSGSYSGLSFDGSGNITDTPVDSVAMCTGGGGIYYIGFTANGPYTLVPKKITGYHYTVPCYVDYTADLTITWQDAVNLNATIAPE